MDPVPDEPTPERKGRGAERGFALCNFGLNTWGDLFNSRQKLTLITFTEKVRLSYKKMLQEGYDPEYAKAMVSYLAICFDRLVDKNSKLVVYDVTRETIEHVFGRQTLSIVWDYVELNPFTDVGWPNMQAWVEKIISHVSEITQKIHFPLNSEAEMIPSPPTVILASATSLP